MTTENSPVDNPKSGGTAASVTPIKGNFVTLPGRGGILGVKAGMTQVYDDDGQAMGVTVIDLQPNIITQIKTTAKEGFNSVQVGLVDRKPGKTKKSELGHVKASGRDRGFYHFEEIRVDSADGITVGGILSPGFIKPGDHVDVTAISKGKGFQGVMKRYHFAGGMKSHGASVCHRQIGSIGNRADPGKVFKGKKMAGQMGRVRVTVQSVPVVRVDAANQLLLVRGSVPGPRTSIVRIQKAIRNPKPFQLAIPKKEATAPGSKKEKGAK